MSDRQNVLRFYLATISKTHLKLYERCSGKYPILYLCSHICFCGVEIFIVLLGEEKKKANKKRNVGTENKQ